MHFQDYFVIGFDTIVLNIIVEYSSVSATKCNTKIKRSEDDDDMENGNPNKNSYKKSRVCDFHNY